MACYCLKGENNLDMPGKICPENLVAILHMMQSLPLELLLISNIFYFKSLALVFLGYYEGDSTRYIFYK